MNSSTTIPASAVDIPVAVDPVESARSAGLHYSCDMDRGIQRRRAGRGFRFVDGNGRPVTDKETLDRIRSLAIPPAWTDVWICCRDDGHLQATGRDARGRKQYLYHPRWRQTRDQWKYERMIVFAETLPAIRARVHDDLARPGLPREKVLAAVVRLLETTLIRIGNDEYARTNNSFGLTTLRNDHVKVNGRRLRFEFRGKAGVEHEIDLHDPRLAKIVRQCQELPGQELFAYLDETDEPRDVGSDDVNEYLREISGQDFTAKDFRTWSGTALAALALADCGDYRTKQEARQTVNHVIGEVAQRLGNTKTVCRKSYIHPAVIDAYLDRNLKPLLERQWRALGGEVPEHLSADEAAVLGLLRELSTT